MKRFLHLTILTLTILAMFAVAGPIPSLAGGEERVMVEFSPGRGGAVQATLTRAGGTVHHRFDNLNVIAVTLPATAIDAIRRNPSVVTVAPDVPRYPMGETVPWGIDRVQAPDAWTVSGSPAGEGVTVCVIDSGLYTDHEDIDATKATSGYPSGWDTDGCGHGTHVAGTIAAAMNDLGVVGVSPDVSLYIVKVFGDNCGWSYSSDLIDATNRCADGGADIINMSLGGGRPIGPWEARQFNSLWNQGILSIAAAGNAGNTQKSYPASHDSVISVAATDIDNVVADFSQQNDQVELSAPGVNVLSTVPWDATTTLTVDGETYQANHIDGAATGNASGSLADGGLCTTTGDWDGNVVLCERGEISFYDKVMNVQNSGGAAAVIYNNEPGSFFGTLGGSSSDILAVSLSQEDGQFLVESRLEGVSDVESTVEKPASGYEAWSGTSMATPHVSGVAALLWSFDSSLTNAAIRSVMADTALDLGPAGRDNAYGYGLVQAYDALIHLGAEGEEGDPPPAENQPPVAAFTYDCTELSCTFDASGSYDPDGTIVSYDWDFGDNKDGSGEEVSHTYGSAGTYNVELTVTDNDGAIGTSSKTVTVSDDSGDPGETVIYVSEIELIPKTAGPNRSATAVVTVVDAAGNLVDGATVYGVWSGDYVADVSGTTGSNGTVSFETGKVRRSATFTFTVSDVVKAGATFDGDQGTTSNTITVP